MAASRTGYRFLHFNKCHPLKRLDNIVFSRCGALQVGDLIETINGRSAGDLSLQEAIDLLSDASARSIKLRILPCPEISTCFFEIDFSLTFSILIKVVTFLVEIIRIHL